MELIRALRGMEDMLPDQAKHWQVLEEKAREIFARFGYGEIRTPVLEETELFQRSIGEVTDIVEKEMWTFQDRKGKSVTLRPEGTASVVRAVLESGLMGKGGTDVPVLKVYYVGPMFRYERPQKGRLRQFHQFGGEVFGDGTPRMDAEVLSLGDLFLREVGMDRVVHLEINSLGNSPSRQRFHEALKRYFSQHRSHLCADCQRRLERNPMRILDCKVAACQGFIEKAPLIAPFLDQESKDHFEQVKRELGRLNVGFVENPRIVRGLDYYSGTTFEFVTKELGSQSAVIAGGRYDGLFAALGGGMQTPAIGFAAGMERLVMLAAQLGIAAAEKGGLRLYLASFGEKPNAFGFELLHRLRATGVQVAADLRERSLKSHLKQADRLLIPFVVILGEEEVEQKRAIWKDMRAGTQSEIQFSDLQDLCQKIKREANSLT